MPHCSKKKDCFYLSHVVFFVGPLCLFRLPHATEQLRAYIAQHSASVLSYYFYPFLYCPNKTPLLLALSIEIVA